RQHTLHSSAAVCCGLTAVFGAETAQGRSHTVRLPWSPGGCRCVLFDGNPQGDLDIPPWMARQIPLKSLFGRRLHGGSPSLPDLRSTGSRPCHSCRSTCLQVGSARWCLSLRWR